jgi:hypothetical protein
MLPWIASQPKVRSRLDDLESQGIDASAMFYSELPAMDDVLAHLHQFRHTHPHDLWTPVWSHTEAPTVLKSADEISGPN